MSTTKKSSSIRYSGWFKQRRPAPHQLRHAHLGKDIAIGERSFGKAYVNCALRGDKSRWGKLRDKNAAVLQLLISPRQDDGYKLRELVVELCFLERNPLLDPHAGLNTEPCLVILEPPSPKYLRGQTIIQPTSQTVSVTPQISALGGSFGGVGFSQNKNLDIERAWRFQSHWSNNDAGMYTNAQWTWKAVADNPDIEDVGALFAGVIIQHPDQPFYITCKVQGKLVNLGKRYRFGNDGERPCYTCVYPESSQRNIQEEVQKLESDIVNLITEAAASR